MGPACGGLRNGVDRRPRSLLLARPGLASVLLAAWLTSPAVWADSLSEVVRLAEQGAPGLALRLIDRQQPAVTDAAETWAQWERQRLDLYVQRQAWNTLVARVETLPQAAPEPFHRQAQTEAAHAELELERPADARNRLLRLIWHSPDSEQLARWRRLVIHSYLQEQRVEDAHSAMVRYAQDYGESGRDWTQLRARVLLQTQRPQDAARLLADAEAPAARSLYLLGALRSGAEPPEAIWETARVLARAEDTAPALQLQLWATAAEAAAQLEDPRRRIPALEQAVALATEAQGDPLMDVNADSLWDAYLAYGHTLGNRAQLLIGDFYPWFEIARRLFDQRPVDARALFAFLALRVDEPELATLAHQQFDLLLQEVTNGAQVRRQLYLASSHFTDVQAVPPVVRYGLVEQALETGDMALASDLVSDLERPPPGQDTWSWQLRRSRVLIRGGSPELGLDVLEQLVAEEIDYDQQRMDRLLQVVFDIQALGRHQAAYGLFEILRPQAPTEKLEREILFWMADSRKAQGRFEEAAQLYLASASLPGPDTMDRWAQTARFHAAGALSRAGLRGDARRIYEALLEVTDDPARRAVLQRNLEQLWQG